MEGAALYTSRTSLNYRFWSGHPASVASLVDRHVHDRLGPSLGDGATRAVSHPTHAQEVLNRDLRGMTLVTSTQPMLARPEGSLGTITHIELTEDTADMVFHGTHTQRQNRADLLI